MRKRAFVGVILIVTTGCYSYVPMEFGALPVGQGVRIYLSRDGVTRLREIGGDQIPGANSDEPVIQGTLVRRSDADFSLLVPVTARQQGFLQSELGQQVTLPTSTVVQSSLRKVSGVKTALTVVGSTALIAGVIVSIIKGARQPQDTPDELPQDLRIPAALP